MKKKLTAADLHPFGDGIPSNETAVTTCTQCGEGCHIEYEVSTTAKCRGCGARMPIPEEFKR